MDKLLLVQNNQFCQLFLYSRTQKMSDAELSTVPQAQTEHERQLNEEFGHLLEKNLLDAFISQQFVKQVFSYLPTNLKKFHGALVETDTKQEWWVVTNSLEKVRLVCCLMDDNETVLNLHDDEKICFRKFREVFVLPQPYVSMKDNDWQGQVLRQIAQLAGLGLKEQNKDMELAKLRKELAQTQQDLAKANTFIATQAVEGQVQQAFGSSDNKCLWCPNLVHHGLAKACKDKDCKKKRKRDSKRKERAQKKPNSETAKGVKGN